MTEEQAKTLKRPIIIRLNPLMEMPVMGIKLLSAKHAEDFTTHGIIHFTNPKTWRDPSICSGKQYDKDEGCFCFSSDKNDEQFKKLGRCFETEQTYDGWRYYENTDLIVGTCFYGIKMSDFHDGVMCYGVKSINTKDMAVSKEYFIEFNYNDESKKTVIIFDFYKFIDLMIKTIMNMGVLKEEIHFSSVYYVNKKVPFCTTESFPFELFLKDDAFKEQSEFRVLIASRNKQFYEKLKENNNNIAIGDISAFTTLQDFYNSGLSFSIQNDKLIYELSTPFSLTMDERSFKELVIELYQIIQNQLPGPPKEKKELDAIAKPIIEHLKTKYDVEYKDDWRLYNVPYDEYLTLPDLYKGMCASLT